MGHTNRNHRMQHGGFEAKWMNPKAGQWPTSLDAELRNLIGQYTVKEPHRSNGGTS